MYSIRSLPTMLYRECADEDGIEDMTQLEYVFIKYVNASLQCVLKTNTQYSHKHPRYQHIQHL